VAGRAACLNGAVKDLRYVLEWWDRAVDLPRTEASAGVLCTMLGIGYDTAGLVQMMEGQSWMCSEGSSVNGIFFAVNHEEVRE
jgi:hypothetical protein